MHISKKLGVLALGGASLFVLSLPLALKAGAQSEIEPSGGGQSLTQDQQPGPQGGPGQGGPGFGGPQGGDRAIQGQRPGAGGFGGMMGGGGGGAAIDSDMTYLYIVQGNQIFKVRKSDLFVEKQNNLGGMQGGPGQGGPGGFGGGQGRGGGQGGRGGGQGGQNPPPSEE